MMYPDPPEPGNMTLSQKITAIAVVGLLILLFVLHLNHMYGM